MKKNTNSFILRSMAMVVSFLIVFWTLNQTVFFGLYQYDVGNIAKENIYLTRNVVDITETEKRKSTIVSETEPILYIDFSKIVESKKNLTDFFARISDIKTSYGEDAELMKRVYAGIEKKNAYSFDEKNLFDIIMLSDEKLRLLENYTLDITSQNMASGISESNIEEILTKIEGFVLSLTDFNETERNLLLLLIRGSIAENQVVDEIKTKTKIDNELNKVEDVVLSKGTLVVSEGGVITERVHLLMSEGGMLVQSTNETTWIILGLAMLLVILWGVMHYYLYAFEKSVLSSTKKYNILIFLFIIAFLFSNFFYKISPIFIPIPAFAMLSGILFSPMIVVFFSSILIILVFFITGMSATIMVGYWVVILYLSILSRQLRQRSQILTDGFSASLILAIFTVAHTLIFKMDYALLPTQLLYAFANGVVSAVITIGVMPIFESVFNILTPFKLLELSNPNRPLLKRLLLEAPGTYHHSVLVGNLAETAAHDIGANSLLTRVAAFYHDIGKLDKPYYFKENQLGKENPHNHLPPVISASIIKSHMALGVELCEKNKLPQEIIEVIKAHHGTSLIKYFYHQELQNNPNVDISKFLYDGPKPESKEAVILMLADSIEAAVRTLDERTKAALTDLVDKIVAQKMAENQMSTSKVTLRELEMIKASFLTVLSGIFHERIVYPEIDLDAISKDTFDEKGDT